MFIGDDTTDLDAFQELEKLRDEERLRVILRVGVASDEGPQEIVSEADIVVDGVEGVGELLRELLGEDRSFHGTQRASGEDA
jgi:trehalose 6-phosphate phosphatase